MSNWLEEKKAFKKVQFPYEKMKQLLADARNEGKYERLNGIILEDSKHCKPNAKPEDKHNTTVVRWIDDRTKDGRWLDWSYMYCSTCKKTVYKKGLILNNETNTSFTHYFEDNRETLSKGDYTELFSPLQ